MLHFIDFNSPFSRFLSVLHRVSLQNLALGVGFSLTSLFGFIVVKISHYYFIKKGNSLCKMAKRQKSYRGSGVTQNGQI